MKLWITAALLMLTSFSFAQETDARKQINNLKKGGLNVPGLGNLKRDNSQDNLRDNKTFRTIPGVEPEDFYPNGLHLTKQEEELAEGIRTHGRDIEIPRLGLGRRAWLKNVICDNSMYYDDVWLRIVFPAELLREHKKTFWSLVVKRYQMQCIDRAYWENLESPRYNANTKFFKKIKRRGHNVASFKKTLALLKSRL